MVLNDCYNIAMNGNGSIYIAQNVCKVVFVLVFIFIKYHFMMRLDPVSRLNEKSGNRKR